MKKCSIYIFAAVLAVPIWAADAGAAGMMAVTFPSKSGWTVSGTAGAPGYEQAHRVNTSSDQSSWGNTYSLVDCNGLSTGAVMDLYASEIWSWYFGAATNDHERMMDSGISSVSGVTEVHVIDIGYASYDVVVYFSSQLEYPLVSKYTIGSTSAYAQLAAMSYFGNNDTYVAVPLTSTADLQGSTPAGNYIVFKNVTGSTLDIQVTAGWYGNSIYTYQPGSPRASISGFQIIEIVENSDVDDEPLLGDLNEDGNIDYFDLAIIAGSWLLEGSTV
ncbi:MAG: hypothetical protein A2Y07_06350 [Planctomycetes bacterium GWF2_50_10]|nr:MAG: hypothetical protein A2Y07_06350 [Planctomycetes bacterium GWF2_50_10]